MENNKEIMKPTTVVRQELIESIANVINECNLPAFIVKPVLQEFLSQVTVAEQKQYEYDKQQYEKELAENTSKE